MRVRDSAIEAAQRAWRTASHGRHGDLPSSETVTAMLTNAAREALEPLRELHRKTQLYELAIEPDCEDRDHDIFEDSDGEWCCRQCTDARDEEEYICAHCFELDSNSAWPCETARLIYPEGEL